MDEDPTADAIVSHVDIHFDWRDRLRILLGRPARVTSRIRTTIASPTTGTPFVRIMGSDSTVSVAPLWRPRGQPVCEAPQ